MVLAKAEKKFISLGKTPKKSTLAVPEEAKGPEKIYYPEFYVDIDLGLDEKDAGKDLSAQVKLTIRRISKDVDSSGKVRHSSSFEVKSIKFT